MATPLQRRRLLLIVGAGAALLLSLLLFFLLTRPEPARSSPPPVVPVQAPQRPRFFDPIAPSAPAPASHSRREQLIEQVRLADHTYCSYRQATRYPHDSRPLGEQPDQADPYAPVVERQPMCEEGGHVNTQVQIQTAQSRVYLAAGESVQLSLRALDANGAPLALAVEQAVAQGLTFGSARRGAQAALLFEGDPLGVHSALFTPARSALAAFEGTIRIHVRYSAGGKRGSVMFDVIHSPTVPAVWSGQVREALEEGALVFQLGLHVREPGRYIVQGRVDDGAGRPFALLTFNELLAAGPAEVRLSLFGKLVRDRAPVMPLTLRDVDGYLLRENADPDRALIARLTGKVHTSRSHAPSGFSDAEWQSEERTRYLTELKADQQRARAALHDTDPDASVAAPCD
jgi:hypothetical protein